MLAFGPGFEVTGSSLLDGRLFSRRACCSLERAMTSENSELNGSAETTPAQEGPEIDPARSTQTRFEWCCGFGRAGTRRIWWAGASETCSSVALPKTSTSRPAPRRTRCEAFFRNCRLIGRRFRLAHVYFKGGKILEVSTFRANPTIAEDPQPSEAIEGEVASEKGTLHIAEADIEALAAVETGAEVPSTPVSDVVDEIEAEEAPDLLITEDNTFGTEIEDALRRELPSSGALL